MTTATVVDSRERFTPEPSRRRSRHVAVAVLGLCAVALAAWAIGWSSALSVTEVRVLGTNTVSSDQIRQAAGIALGTPLARVDSAGVTARVEQIPAVDTVEVRLGWPHVLVLAVTERIPVAVIASGSALAVVDVAGVPFRSATIRPPSLPLLSASSDSAMHAALVVIAGLPTDIGSQVSAVSARTPDDVVLTLASPVTVRWGGVNAADRKAAVLRALLPQRAKTYDVSAPELPTTRGKAAR